VVLDLLSPLSHMDEILAERISPNSRLRYKTRGAIRKRKEIQNRNGTKPQFSKRSRNRNDIKIQEVATQRS
jgi:hypothetical protein